MQTECSTMLLIFLNRDDFYWTDGVKILIRLILFILIFLDLTYFFNRIMRVVQIKHEFN
jgi:hypothetical protein